MKRFLPFPLCFFLLAFFFFNSSQAQNAGYTDHSGRVVDAATGKPLPYVKVTHAIGGQADEKGRFTVRYYGNEGDKRVIVSHPGYYTDTFNFAPAFVRMRRQPLRFRQMDRPKVAVVLSGGGAKGVAHISALRVIEEAGLPVDMVCGTSMGSLVGALYCLGYSPDFLDSLVRNQDWVSLLSDRTDPTTLSLRQREEQNTYTIIRNIGRHTSANNRNSELRTANSELQRGGIIRGHNLDHLFRQLCYGYLDSIDFNALPIPFACVATDLVSNTEVDFRSGSLVDAMRASMAIPGVFTPVRMGDSVLVDGGLRNNYPVDLARAMGADIIIGVSVQNDLLTADEINTASDVLSQIIDFNTKNKYENNREMSDVLIKVDVNGYSAGSFTRSAIDTLLARGDHEARNHWDELLALRRRCNIDSLPLLPESERRHLPVDSRPTRGNALHLPTTTIASAGYRFDTEETGVLILSGKMPLRTFIPMGIAATLRLGKRITVHAEHSMLTHRVGVSPTLGYTYNDNNVDLYTDGVRTQNIRYRQHTLDLTPLDLALRNNIIRAGARWDYYDYYGQLLTADGTAPQLNDDHFVSYYVSSDINSEDLWYFPTRGIRFHALCAYRTNNFIGIDDGIGLSDISAYWRINFTSVKRITLQPMLYTRLLLGAEPPLAYYNAIGGEWFGHIVDQQMPFAGMGHLEYTEKLLVAAQLQTSIAFGRHSHILLRVATAASADHFDQMISRELLTGFQAGYSYSTIIGPLDARLGFTSRQHSPYFLLSIGHVF